VDGHEVEFDLHLRLIKAIEEDPEIIIRFANPQLTLQASQYTGR